MLTLALALAGLADAQAFTLHAARVTCTPLGCTTGGAGVEVRRLATGTYRLNYGKSAFPLEAAPLVVAENGAAVRCKPVELFGETCTTRSGCSWTRL